ncbi:MAG: VanZ family protein [Bacillota bacterium]
MRLLVFFLYVGFLFLLTCTASLTDLIHNQEIRFVLTQPDLLSFFEYRFAYRERSYIVQKSGHFVSFFILALLVRGCFNSVKSVINFSWTTALFTEAAQLFFSRTGCLVDVIYDLAGAGLFLLSHLLWQIFRKDVKNYIREAAG